MHRKIILSVGIVSLLYVGNAIAEIGVTPATNSQEDQSTKKLIEEDAHLQEIVNQVFREAQIKQLPLSVDHIDEFQNRLDQTGAAINPYPAPKLVNRSQNVSLEPGADPITVRLASGYVSSVLIIDSTGEPWPITTATVGNDKWFSVVKPETGANNMLTINALNNHVSSNMAVTLEGRDAPLIIQLTMNDYSADKKLQEADMLITMRMNQLGPKAAPPIIGNKINSPVSSELMSFLDGVPTPGASIVKLKNAPEGVQAWTLNQQLYLRTPYPIRWPAHEQHAGRSGMNAYVMPVTSQIILSMNGISHMITVVQ